MKNIRAIELDIYENKIKSLLLYKTNENIRGINDLFPDQNRL